MNRGFLLGRLAKLGFAVVVIGTLSFLITAWSTDLCPRFMPAYPPEWGVVRYLASCRVALPVSAVLVLVGGLVLVAGVLAYLLRPRHLPVDTEPGDP